MKKTSMWCLIALLSLGSAAWSLAQGTQSTEEAVIRLEEQWFHAQATSNPDLLAPLLADKAVITGSEGKVTSKAEALATCKNSKWNKVQISDMNLTVFGNTVIATGDLKVDGTDASGKPFDMHERWTYTWVKMPSGQWQCVAVHTSPVTV
jgi:ketosteroid isomerase-like protein